VWVAESSLLLWDPYSLSLVLGVCLQTSVNAGQTFQGRIEVEICHQLVEILNLHIRQNSRQSRPFFYDEISGLAIIALKEVL